MARPRSCRLARHHETLDALDAGIAAARRGRPRPADLEAHGGAWVGEEALAIAVACAVGIDDPVEAVLAAVNHGGDSDSTGAICGNLLGAGHGSGCIPARWLDPAWWHRYPGW